MAVQPVMKLRFMDEADKKETEGKKKRSSQRRKEIRRWDPWEGAKKDARLSDTRMRGRWIPR